MHMDLGGPWELVMDRETGMLQFMGLQRVGHDWATELNYWGIKDSLIWMLSRLNGLKKII